MRRNKWVAVITLAAAGWLSACAGDAGETEDTTDTTEQVTPTDTPTAVGTGATGTPPEGADVAMVTAGQQIFTGKGICYSCHGQDGTGTPLAPNLTDSEWLNVSADPSWDELQQLVRNGVPTPKEHPSPMPPMGGAQLSDQEIQQVTAYVYSLSHPAS